MFEFFDRIGIDRETRQRAAQKIFWNRFGETVVKAAKRAESLFDTVIRNYSIMSDANGESWLPTTLPSSPLVFDVGFYEGDYTRTVLSHRPGATIVGFDPSEHAQCCFDPADFPGGARVTLEQLALSNTPGEATFFDYDNMCNSLSPRRERSSEAVREYQVAVDTLDDYVDKKNLDANRIDLLKVDAEGHDVEVLEGAQELLEAQRIDLFMFEFSSAWVNSRYYLRDMVDLLEPTPYRLFRLFNGFLNRFDYDWSIDSCTTRSAMYVGLSERRLERGDIPIRDLDL